MKISGMVHSSPLGASQLVVDSEAIVNVSVLFVVSASG